MRTIREQAFRAEPISHFLIDAHTHLAPYYRSGWHQKPGMADIEEMLRIYDRLGVDCCVTAPHMLCDSMTVWANEFAEQAIREYPGRIYGYISIAPFEGMEAVRENLRRFGGNPGFVGLKFLGGYNGDLTEPEYRYAADFANEAGCPILCHSWEDTPRLAVLKELAQTHPRLHILCAHQGGGNKRMTDRAAEIVREMPNFHLEICGSLWNEYGVEDLVRLVGSDRVIFGTDAINLDARFDFGRVVFAPLEDEDMRKILSGNYLRLMEKSQMGRISVRSK